MTCRTTVLSLPGLLLMLLSLPVFAQAPSAPQTLDEATGIVVPILYDPLLTPQPLVMVRLNGQPPIPFMIDTGTSAPILLDESVVEQFHLKRNGHKINDPGGRPFGEEVDAGSLEMVFFGETGGQTAGLRLPTNLCIAKNLSRASANFAGPPLGGIIGINISMLGGSTVRFDFVAKTMTLFLNPHGPLHVPGATVLKMVQHQDDSGFYYIPMPLPQNKKGDLLIDTGNNATIISPDMVPLLKPLTMASVSAYYTDTEGTTETKKLLLKQFSLGNAAASSGSLKVSHAEVAVQPIPVVGMDLMSRYRLTLDFRNDEMILEPVKGVSPDPPLPGIAHIVVQELKDHYLVQKVDRGSEAEKQGIHKGDRIVEVDGKPLAGLHEHPAQAFLNGYAGTKADLLIEPADATGSTNSAPRHILLTRDNYYHPAGVPKKSGKP